MMVILRPTLALALAALCALATATKAPAAPSDREAEIRAAMLANFVRYADWTGADRPVRPGGRAVICVSPSAPIAQAVFALDGRALDERTLVVRALNDAEEGACDVAYLDRHDATRERAAALAAEGVLTVSADDGFVDHGAIELVRVGRQTRFKVNNGLAQDAGVRLSSRLLRLAVEVR